MGPDRILSMCDPDRPVAHGPVCRFLKVGPVGPKRMFSLDELNQPVAVGPVDQPFATGPVGTHVRVSDYKRMDRIDDSPVGSTSILDPVKQTGNPIQTDFMNIGTVDEPASLGDTPPSSDSGVHSLGEQWENMSTNSMDMESEQNERPTYDRSLRWRVSDTRVPPNTEEDEDIDYPRADRLLARESDENSLFDIQQNDRKIQYNKVTIYGSENSTVNSGTDARNSDIGALSDFLDDNEETGVEQLSGCRIPGCQCDGRIAFMEWGLEDMTETDDSEYEGSIDRANRLYVESYNYDLSKGYNPPLRRNRRRRYEVRIKNEVDVEESITVTSDRVFQADKESPKLEPTVQPRTVADDDIPKLRDKPVDREWGSHTGSDMDMSSDEDSNLCDRLATESATEWDGQYSQDTNNKEYWINVNLQTREAMREMTGTDANLSGDKYPDVVEEIARKRAWAENDALPVEQRTGCEVPGCQCNGRVEYMDWGSEDMTETDDSEYEDPVDRDNRLYVESCNCDLSEGRTPRTYTPPLRRNRRRRYEVWKNYKTDIEDSMCGTIDDGFLTNEESPNSEHMVQPRTVADNVNRTVRNRNNNRGRWTWPGSENDITSDENSNLFDRPVTESATAGAGIETDSFSVEHVKCCAIPVTDLITITLELSELGTSVCSETNISDIPVIEECVIPERQWHVNYDLSEGMAPRTYTRPLRRNRRRRYEVQKKNERDIKESISGTSDKGSRTVEDPTSPEQPIESNTADDNVYTATLRDDKDTYSQSELTGLTGCGAYSSTGELWELVDRPVTEGDMAWSGIKTDFPCQEHSGIIDRPVTDSVSARVENDTMYPSYEHSDRQSVLVDKPGTESLMSMSGSKTNLLSDELSEMVDRPVNESVTAGDGSRLDSPQRGTFICRQPTGHGVGEDTVQRCCGLSL